MLPLKSLFQRGGNLMYSSPPSLSPLVFVRYALRPKHGVIPNPDRPLPPPFLTCILAYKKAQGLSCIFSYPLLLALCFEGSLTPEVSPCWRDLNPLS